MNNHWNRWIYRLWSPIYDTFFNKGPFLRARREVFREIPFKKGDKILFVGVGTGADLEQIPVKLLNITAIDYSADMLQQAKNKFPAGEIDFQQMDAQALKFPDGSFDYVVASLVLSVVPGTNKAFSEMSRVCQSGGQILIFDKFAAKPSWLNALFRPIIKVLGTDIGLSFDKIFAGSEGLCILEDRPVLFGGMYRKIRIGKS
ncbi:MULTISPECIES: class I SAM-dependent methyltransferase [Bacillaceae]|uniref:class I SAM-dependent methyltransferase n=1 Tax=Bacillaceae TaxID=186817 RepID=UPI002FFD8997